MPFNVFTTVGDDGREKGCQLIGNLILLGGKKTEEIILGQEPDTQPFPNIQRGKPYQAPSALISCRQISQSASDNQVIFQKSIQALSLRDQLAQKS
jgi:hypothetical protein